MVAVLDASAVLALIQKEAGGAQVVGYLQGGRMSAANYAEVLHTLGRSGIEIEQCLGRDADQIAGHSACSPVTRYLFVHI